MEPLLSSPRGGMAVPLYITGGPLGVVASL